MNYNSYRFLFIISFVYLICMTNVLTAFAEEKDIAIIYTTKQQTESTAYVQAMLNAYAAVDTLSIDEVDHQRLQTYKQVIVISYTSSKMPQKALDALNSFQGSAIAIGENTLQLAPFSQWQMGKKVELRAIGEHIFDQTITWQSIIPSSDAKVVKEASTLQKNYPFIVQAAQGNWSYIGEIIDNKAMQYEWPRIITDLLLLQAPFNHQAFIVLTDINAQTDSKQLEKVVDMFIAKQIPISLEIAPIYVKKDHAVLYLQDNQNLLSYLQKLQKRGLPFVLSSANMPLEESLNYLVQRKIYPILTNEDSPLFTGVVQQHNQTSLYITHQGQQTYYPYTVTELASISDDFFYPVQRRMEQVLQVPGSVLGIAYPAYLNATYAEQLIAYVQKKPELKWLDFKKTNQTVQTDNGKISQEITGEQTNDMAFSYRERLKMRFQESPFEVMLWGLVLTVALFVALFFVNTFRLRITLRKRLFEERKTNG
ncbi:DUF2334 domain-containing protein [Lysinibacillus piscis]|uniref:DUF2334 domain-containing protein n=1 Tax=Lysinibacillus piscis TaxID=2518931 RepID=A0ABQ5NKG5_9BACI|nr:DUF2334 domain-containing protein [Lysinibacillus sp. KH24]GLC88608.1 hypothetical protein LYSBPC_17350 [Lysinibacillus sp. KH24]